MQRTGALQQRHPVMQHRMAAFHPIVSPPGLGPGLAKPKSSILYSTGYNKWRTIVCSVDYTVVPFRKVTSLGLTKFFMSF